jgi:hypothetical protein
LYLRCKVFEIDKSTVTTPSAGGLVAWENFATFQDDANKPPLAAHPLFFVKAHDTRGNGVDGMVATHFDL